MSELNLLEINVGKKIGKKSPQPPPILARAGENRDTSGSDHEKKKNTFAVQVDEDVFLMASTIAKVKRMSQKKLASPILRPVMLALWAETFGSSPPKPPADASF